MVESAIWALSAAAGFGAALVTARQGLRYATPLAGAAIGVPFTTLMFWLPAPFLLETGEFSLFAAGIFALVGLFFPATVTLLTYSGNQRMGPTVTGAISCTTPMFALLGALLFLGEALSPGNLLGTGVVVAGMLALTWSGGTRKRDWPVWAIGLPLAAAAIRALAQVLTKAGLAHWSSPYAAGLIGYTASAVVILIAARIGGASKPRDLRAIPWFVATGFFNGGGLLLMYMALAGGRVSAVSPIVATYPLFTLALSLLLLKHERVTKGMALGAALTVGGVILLFLN